MAKCVITFEDDGDDLKVKVDFEPHQRLLQTTQRSSGRVLQRRKCAGRSPSQVVVGI